MDWNKALGYLSNIVTILVIGLTVLAVIKFVPDAEWAGNVISVALGGMVGYLKGISTSSK